MPARRSRLDDKSDQFSSKLRLLGAVEPDAERRHRHDGEPRFRAYSYDGFAGTELEVWVRSSDGDPIAWLADESFRVLARSDDSSRRGPDPVKLYVIFREYSDAPAKFRVRAGELDRPEPEPSGGCVDDGARYQAGESWDTLDGCSHGTCRFDSIDCSHRC